MSASSGGNPSREPVPRDPVPGWLMGTRPGLAYRRLPPTGRPSGRPSRIEQTRPNRPDPGWLLAGWRRRPPDLGRATLRNDWCGHPARCLLRVASMTLARSVLPGMTVMVTRRTVRRVHLLRPDPQVRELYLYFLAVLAKRYGILVHSVVLMSTHPHLVVTDTRGNLLLFLREFHRMVALALKVMRKWEGPVWDHERPSVVHLRTPQAVIESLAYSMANPVASGLVRRARDWPGVNTLPEALGRGRWTVNRPAQYVDPNNPMWPEQATLELTMPPGMPMRDDKVRQAVADELQALEKQAHATVRTKGIAFLGAERARTGSPYKRSKSWEPLRGRNPSFAVGKDQPEAFREAVQALRAFRQSYREALTRWRDGLRSVVFPAGTWMMQWLHRAAVAPPLAA